MPTLNSVLDRINSDVLDTGYQGPITREGMLYDVFVGQASVDLWTKQYNLIRGMELGRDGSPFRALFSIIHTATFEDVLERWELRQQSPDELNERDVTELFTKRIPWKTVEAWMASMGLEVPPRRDRLHWTTAYRMSQFVSILYDPREIVETVFAEVSDIDFTQESFPDREIEGALAAILFMLSQRSGV